MILCNIIRALSSERGPSNMRKMRSFRDHPWQSIIRDFALNSYIPLYLMTLLKNSEDPDQKLRLRWAFAVRIFQDTLLNGAAQLALVILNKSRCHAYFQFSANQFSSSRLLIQIQILNGKQCRARSVGFFRNQLIWIYTVSKGRVYPGSAGQG